MGFIFKIPYKQYKRITLHLKYIDMIAILRKCLCLLSILLFGFSMESAAYRIEHLGIEDGLSDGYVNDFELDSLGYMWVATSNGLNRYSGYEIKNYSFNERTNKYSNRIIELINNKGELYVINGGGGIYKYQYDYDNFIALGEANEGEFLSACLVGNNHLVIGLLNGLLVYNLNTKCFSEVLYSEITYNRHLMYFGNKIYIATSKGVHTFSIQNDSLIKGDVYLEQMDIININMDSESRLWVGTEKNGLILIDDELKISTIPLSKTKQNDNTIRSITFDKQGDALVAVDRFGLFVIDKSLNIQKQFKHNPDDENSIKQNSIHHIYVDKYNTYWMASGEMGVDILDNTNRPFQNICHILNKKNSLHNNSVRSIGEDKFGNIWFGTEDGLSRLSTTGVWTAYNETKDLLGMPVLSISKYNEQFLLGTYGKGLIGLNLANGNTYSPILYDKPQHKLLFKTLVDGNDLWIGGTDGPVMYFTGGKLRQTYPLGSIKCFVKGSEENMFAGGVNGVFELNMRNGSYKKLLYSTETSNNRLANVYALYYDQNHNLWIGNDDGLFVYDLKRNIVEQKNLNEDKKVGIVYSLLPDNSNNLWMGTSNGLWKLDVSNKQLRHYDERDGIKANKFGFGASMKRTNGELAFGGPDGAVLFHPDSVREYINTGKLRVSNFLINGLVPNTTAIVKDINYEKEIELNYNQNSLSFEFEIVDLHGPRKIIFEWQLLGYDQSVIRSIDKRIASYTKLDPGVYQLLVRAISPDGKYLSSEYSLSIKIFKPFWLRWWAFVIYAIVILGLIVLLAIANRAKQKQRFSDEKIQFFVNVAHDIRTPVSLIQLLVEQLPKTEKSKDAIELIMRNAGNLNEYVSQLLEFQKAERQKLKLKVRQVKINKILQSIVSDFQPLLEKKSMDISISSQTANVWVDVAKISRVFNNLISNAIKYSEEGSSIRIETHLLEGRIKVNIIDNGLGVPEKQQEQIFTRFTRGENVRLSGISGTGIGLVLSKRIVELHHGKMYLESKLNIGSTFSVELLLGSQHFRGDEIVIEEDNINNEQKVSDIIGENKLILLVEDNADLRATIKSELEKTYRVLEAPNGKEGLVIAIEKNPDVIITDVLMPIMNGKELCQVVKGNIKTSHIPIVMITALSGVDDKVEGLEVGADAYVEKPFSIEVLKATINNLLRNRRAMGMKIDKEEIKKANYASPDEELLSKAVELIKENLTDRDFTIDALCDKLGYSRSNLFRKLKGLTGMTPSDLIIKIKLNHAVELFKSNQTMRIADIAYESGFHDPKYFSTVFKKFYGKTPKQFMESQN